MSSYPMIIWAALSVIWLILFLYGVDRIQKSKSTRKSETEKRIQNLEEENQRLKEKEKREG